MSGASIHDEMAVPRKRMCLDWSAVTPKRLYAFTASLNYFTGFADWQP